MKYANVSGMPTEFNTPDHWALGFCVFEFLASVRDHAYHEAIDRLLNGGGFMSEEGWELCRVRERILASEIEVSPEGANGFLAWTDPEDFGYEPPWRVYTESEFKAVFPKACVECQKQAGRSYDPKLSAALEHFFP